MAGYGEPSFHRHVISSSFPLQDRGQRVERVWEARLESVHQAHHEGAVVCRWLAWLDPILDSLLFQPESRHYERQVRKEIARMISPNGRSGLGWFMIP